jgi:hypothetical protein
MENTRTRMRRRFVAAIASAAIALAALTAAAMPARADNKDLARALAAIAALAIIAKTVDDNRDRDRGRDHGWHGGHPRPPVYQPDPWPRPARNVLPRECAMALGDRGRREIWYARSCLQDHGVRVNPPRHCAAEVRIRGRKVTAYRQDCLINAGFRPERGRHDNR